MINPILREEIEQRQASVRALTDAIRTGELEALGNAIELLERYSTWKVAFRACGRMKVDASAAMKDAFYEHYWLPAGETLRSNVNDDIVLLNALVRLLPSYSGGDVELYRGESAGNRSRRTYGMSWTSLRDVARQFDQNNARFYSGGTVLLRTVAPASAIICPPQPSSHIEEYVVDRRRLVRVEVLERYPA